MRLSLFSDADASEPVVIADVKRQVRLPGASDEDKLLSGIYIPAARERCETATRRQMRVVTYDAKLDGFPAAAAWIELPRPPLISVTSITYVDGDGTTQTWASNQYVVDAPSGPKAARGRISPAYGVTWPTTRDQMNAVTIRFVAGYGHASGPRLPPLLKAAMLLDIATMFENRENLVIGTIVAEVPQTSKDIYRSFESLPSQWGI